MKLLLIRHGETESNIRDIYAGSSEEGLTRRGRLQASEIAQKIARLGSDAVYTSPLRRAVETADLVGRSLGLVPKVESDFMELKLGQWEGLSSCQIVRRFPNEWRLWNESPAKLIMPGRETLAELLERMIRRFEKIGSFQQNGRIAIVTHVSNIRVLLLYASALQKNGRQSKPEKPLGIDLDEYKAISVPNGSIHEIEYT